MCRPFLAVADLAGIAERRVDRMLDPARSQGIPPFLAAEPGVDIGSMIAHCTAAGIVSTLKRPEGFARKTSSAPARSKKFVSLRDGD